MWKLFVFFSFEQWKKRNFCNMVSSRKVNRQFIEYVKLQSQSRKTNSLRQELFIIIESMIFRLKGTFSQVYDYLSCFFRRSSKAEKSPGKRRHSLAAKLNFLNLWIPWQRTDSWNVCFEYVYYVSKWSLSNEENNRIIVPVKLKFFDIKMNWYFFMNPIHKF